MIKSNYEVEILVNGSPIQEYFHNGRNFIEARDGNNFSIKIRNNGYRRILAIPSVDGLSVMNGKKASFKSGGYIINGYSSMTIDGWRVSDDEVRRFFFTNPGNSYAGRKGEAGNLGVIGIAVFREKERTYEWRVKGGLIPQGELEPPYHSYTLTASNNAMYSCSSLSASGTNSVFRSVKNDMGTGFGESKTSLVTTVSFEEEDQADAVFELHYNSRKQLERMGVEFRPIQYVTPQAFPNQYCEEPTR